MKLKCLTDRIKRPGSLQNLPRHEVSWRVAQLLLSRKLWVRREIISRDFREDDPSCVDQHTFDVDTSFIAKIYSGYSGPHVYIPLKWREKGTIFAIDCTTADGRSLRILNRSFNEFFAELFFWQVSEVYGYTRSSLPLIAAIVRRGIEATKDDIQVLLTAVDALFETQIESVGDLEQQDERAVWHKMQTVPEIRKLWELVLGHHIVVARVPKDTDHSILKLAERRDFPVPPKVRFNPFNATFSLQFEEPQVPLTKLKVPKDVRILHCFGVVSKDKDTDGASSSLPEPGPMGATAAEMSSLGDGTWSAHYSHIVGASVSWTAFLAPHRMPALVPGAITSGAATVLVYTWWSRKNSVFLLLDDSNSVSKSIPFLVILALAPTVASTILAQDSHSPLYRAITKKYWFLMALVAALVFLFTLLPVERPSEVSWLTWLPDYAEHLVLWFSGHLRGIAFYTILGCFATFVASLASASPTLSTFVLWLRRRIARR